MKWTVDSGLDKTANDSLSINWPRDQTSRPASLLKQELSKKVLHLVSSLGFFLRFNDEPKRIVVPESSQRLRSWHWILCLVAKSLPTFSWQWSFVGLSWWTEGESVSFHSKFRSEKIHLRLKWSFPLDTRRTPQLEGRKRKGQFQAAI